MSNVRRADKRELAAEESRHIVTLSFCKPMECFSAKKLPTGEQWTYEIKLEGFRVEAVRTPKQVILYSKQDKLLTSQFVQHKPNVPVLIPDGCVALANATRPTHP